MKMKELLNSNEKPKALSIKQPWAWLIVNGHKDIENRSWNTKYRGTFLVHASQGFDSKGYDDIKNGLYGNIPNLPDKDDFQYGGIVGQADIVDCVIPNSKCESVWYQGLYGFVLKNQSTLPFKPLKGKLNFFTVE